MQITTRQVHDVQLLALAGRFDAHEVAQVRKALEAAATSSPVRVVVDLGDVHFIDSSGLATLVQGMKRCREQGGDLVLCNLQQPVRIIFELTRLDRAFGVFSSAESAVASFGAGA